MIALYSAALFVSAALLFSIQLIFSKMVLPLLGGTPTVWNTCMLFFQAALLAGYAYAHVAPRWLGHRRHALLHVGLLGASLAALPITIARHQVPAADASPVPWLLGVLAITLGAPFFLLSATAPLLQSWFARSGHPASRNPYFLYAASNLGSMLALLAYPVAVEPRWRLGEQSAGWSAGFGVLIVLIAACAGTLWLRAGRDGDGVAPVADVGEASVPSAPVSSQQRLMWVLLSLVPSSLLLGVTTHITTDVAAVPLLWVIPLAVYLLTFALTFARRRVVSLRAMLWLQLALVLFWLPFRFLGLEPFSGLSSVLLHLLLFFATAMVCHGQLADRRPAAGHVTEFYLWVSVGGVLGGVLNVLVAPVVFNGVMEYPLMLAAACLLRPATATRDGRRTARLVDVALPLILALGLVAAAPAVGHHLADLGVPGRLLACAAIVLLCLGVRERPLRLGLVVAALFVAGEAAGRGGDALLARRSFFGVYRVRESTDGEYRLLSHGTTLHGAQALDPARRREPLTYYHQPGPLGQLFAARGTGDPGARTAIIGLGTGAAACYRTPGQHWTYYEIDPLIERIARDARYFTYLADCTPAARVVLGDARVSLERAPRERFDVLVLDAFSSDAIPVHLLTREALDLYVERLAPGGWLALHVTNRHLDLEPVVAVLARDAGLVGLLQSWEPAPADRERLYAATIWIVLARRAEDLDVLARDARWRPLRMRGDVRPWTDDYSNIVQVYDWRGR